MKYRQFAAMFHPFVLVLITVIISLSSFGQTTRNHGVFWGRIAIADSVNARLNWELFLQKRTQNIPGRKSIFGAPHYINIWFWMNVKITESIRLGFSPFAYFDSHAFMTEPSEVDLPGVKELRSALRVEYQQKFRFFSFLNRYNMEYRRRDLQHNDEFVPNWRFRHLARVEKSLRSVLVKKKPVMIFFSDELLVQFGKAVRNNPSVFDQNRLSAGFSMEVMRDVKTSFSYLNIYQLRNNGKDFDNAHALWVILLINNFSGKL